MTIVVCSRDRPELLAGALRALGAAAPPDAVLVVDSASRTAETRTVCREAGVGYVRSDIPGLSIARNVGLSHATAEIVVYTDDDCAVDPGFLEPLIAPFADPAVAATTGLLRDVSADVLAESSAETGANTVLDSVTEGLDAGHGALMAFRRADLEAAGGFDPVLGAGRRFGGAEDLDAFCRLLAADLRLVRVPSAVVTHLFTRADDDYVRLNEAYGLGIGAMCGKWLRTNPLAGRRLQRIVVRRALVRYTRRIGSTRTRRGQAAFMRGLRRGISGARSLPIDHGVFSDVHPPAAITLTEPATTENQQAIA